MSRYSILVEELDGPPGQTGRTLQFNVENHDDIFNIINRLKQGDAVPTTEAEELGLGLKLFSEVVIRHRKEEIFSDMFKDIGRFIKKLKAQSP